MKSCPAPSMETKTRRVAPLPRAAETAKGPKPPHAVSAAPLGW